MAEKKKLLVLGGLALEIEAVKIAQEMGAEVIVVDYFDEKKAPAKKYADKHYMISATDDDALYELAVSEKVDGVFVGYADSLLTHYALLCNRLGVPCYCSYEQARIMTDKRAFKECCKKYNVPTIQDYSEEDCISGVIASYPILVKPTDRSGSMGIRVCRNYDELVAGIINAKAISRSNDCLIERYMTGDEVVLYYYMQDGEISFAGMCDRYVNHEEAALAQLPTAYVFPSIYTEEHLLHTDIAIREMLAGLGLTNGVIFLQAFIENGTPVLYEPGYRLCGARDHAIFSSTNDVDMERLLVNFALTGSLSEERISSKLNPRLPGVYACKLSPLVGKGMISRIEGIDELYKHPCVRRVYLNNDVGDSIDDDSLGTLKQIAYRCYLVANSPEQLAAAIDFAHANVDYFDENGKSMMMRPFSSDIVRTRYK